MVIISRWLVFVGHRSSLTLHVTIEDSTSVFLHTLSGLVHLPLFWALSVGRCPGRAISSCMLTMRSRRGLRSLLGLVR